MEKKGKEQTKTNTEVATIETAEVSTKKQDVELINISEDVFLTVEEMQALLKNNNVIEEKKSALYLKGNSFAIGEAKRFIFLGKRPFKGAMAKEGSECVVLFDGNEMYINASVPLVSDCGSLSINDTIEITYKGSKPAKVGNMDLWGVSKLHHFKARA